MKIADVRGRTVRGTVRPLRIGGGLTWDVSYCSTIVEIETDEGLIGRGETWFGFGEEQETVIARAIDASLSRSWWVRIPRNHLSVEETLELR